jgi:hypothetical protein
MDYNGVLISAYQLFWEEDFVTSQDSKNANMGAKTTCLEIIGLLLHIVFFPCLFTNRHVVFKTDNIACYYGWDNKCIKNDSMASIILRCICILSAKLCCTIHVEHLPRISTWEATVADRLSRRSTSTRWDRNLVNSFKHAPLPPFLRHWLSHPTEDWSLPVRISEELVVSNTNL